jgi:3-hydroxyacyl-CoA dehydrogenase
MSNSKLDRVAVLGAGVLGGQIALHSAFKGKSVSLQSARPWRHVLSHATTRASRAE